jgi:hypothetical protein
MCLCTFLKFTFSTKEAFHRALDKIDEDGLGECSVHGELCLITDTSGLDLNREPYEVLKEKVSFIHAPFCRWDELKKIIKMSKGFPVCGEIILELRNGYKVSKYPA